MNTGVDTINSLGAEPEESNARRRIIVCKHLRIDLFKRFIICIAQRMRRTQRPPTSGWHAVMKNVSFQRDSHCWHNPIQICKYAWCKHVPLDATQPPDANRSSCMFLQMQCYGNGRMLRSEVAGKEARRQSQGEIYARRKKRTLESVGARRRRCGGRGQPIARRRCCRCCVEPTRPGRDVSAKLPGLSISPSVIVSTLSSSNSETRLHYS